MLLEKNKSLQPYNTFGIEATAEYFTEVTNENSLSESIQLPFSKKMLGGGSNILLTGNVKGLLIHNKIEHFEVEKETNSTAIVSLGGGNNWHKSVLWCIENDLGGIENLSLIPGTVGASPIQNIGAYGVELQDVFLNLEAVHLTTGERVVFSKEECQFGYRDSIFKNKYKEEFCIVKVRLQLSKKYHTYRTNYGDIRQTLDDCRVQELSLKAVSDAVVSIRQSKLPNPAELGNAGSFFKNPEIPAAQKDKLLEKYPLMPHYPLADGRVKIPAGWLIEQCGWKGRRIGNTGSHSRQALVLVNYGNATGSEVYALAQNIADSVFEKFEIKIFPEVNVWKEM